VSQLQELIASSSVRAYQQGARDERGRILHTITEQIQKIENTQADLTLEQTDVLRGLKKAELYVKEMKWI
jgi:hypothetical protein